MSKAILLTPLQDYEIEADPLPPVGSVIDIGEKRLEVVSWVYSTAPYLDRCLKASLMILTEEVEHD